MGVLVVRTLDETRRTDGRAHPLTAADGKFYAPADAYARVSAAGDRIFHSTGESTVEVPAGKVALDGGEGVRVWPRGRRPRSRPNEVTTVTLTLKRLTDMTARGWYSGSTHVHMNYAGNLHNTLENLMIMAAAEDQDIVQRADRQQGQPRARPPVLRAGRRAAPALASPRCCSWSARNTGRRSTATCSCWAARSPDLAVRHRLRGHGDREPVSEQHGHVPEGQRSRARTSATCTPSPASSIRSSRPRRAKGFMVDAALGTVDALEWSARAGPASSRGTRR